MSLSVLNYAKEKLLSGDFNMATAYYNRANNEGVADCVVKLRYLTKEYLVYPLEYEGSCNYFELLKQLKQLANTSPAYQGEYVLALRSLLNIRKIFLRSLSLFYFSDILVTPADSIVIREILQLQNYIKRNKANILDADIYETQKYIPGFNKYIFSRDLNIVEAYCMNILLSYTAEQHSIYQGKRYSATTIDYGYFYSTTIRASDRYYNYANIKPRIFVLGYEAYYYDMRNNFQQTVRELGIPDLTQNLRKELTAYINHTPKEDASDLEFNQYAKHFEKQDPARESFYSSMVKLANAVNPMHRLNPMNKLFKRNVGSFELDEYFPQKKLWGVCSMLAAGQGWKVDTVRYVFAIFACFAGMGALAYFALAIAKKSGIYFGVNIQKP